MKREKERTVCGRALEGEKTWGGIPGEKRGEKKA